MTDIFVYSKIELLLLLPPVPPLGVSAKSLKSKLHYRVLSSFYGHGGVFNSFSGSINEHPRILIFTSNGSAEGACSQSAHINIGCPSIFVT